jgi:hypothetical protein
MVIIKLHYDIQHNGASKIKMLILLISTQFGPCVVPGVNFAPRKAGDASCGLHSHTKWQEQDFMNSSVRCTLHCHDVHIT